MLTHAPSARLRAARTLVLLIGVLTVLLYTAGAPLYVRDLSQGCLQTACDYGLVVTPSAADVAVLGLSVPAYARLLTAIEVVHAWFFFSVAALLFWRAPANPIALLGALFLLSWGATHTNPLYALAAAVPPMRLPVNLLAFTSNVTLFAFFALFPSGQFVPRAMRYLLAAWVVIAFVVELSPQSAELTDNLWLLLVTLGAFIGFFVSLVVAQLYRYRRVSTPTQREQTKWVVYGLTVAITSFIVVLTLGAIVDPAPQSRAAWGLVYYLAIYAATLIIPLSLLGAILQSRLWSIDLIIRRTLIYTLLTLALVTLYFAAVVVFENALRPLTGQAPNTLVTVLSTLAIAALFSPLRQWLQAAIDRRFYRHKYDAARTLSAFGATLRDDVDLDVLADRLVGAVEDTMQPRHTWLWLPPETRAPAVRAAAQLEKDRR